MPPKYKSFVLGSAENYDSMGRNQFELLRFFGLAEQHYLLDIGCGSLSGGRFAIRLLAPGHYFGIEPEGWLVDEGIRNEVGQSLLESKRPAFSNDANFNLGLFGQRFDYMIAHSILTHASQAQMRILFNEAARVMAERGVFLATYRMGETDYNGDQWVYPDGVRYTLERIQSLAAEAGLGCAPVTWPHPRQSWLVLYGEATSGFVNERLRAAAA